MSNTNNISVKSYDKLRLYKVGYDVLLNKLEDLKTLRTLKIELGFQLLFLLIFIIFLLLQANTRGTNQMNNFLRKTIEEQHFLTVINGDKHITLPEIESPLEYYQWLNNVIYPTFFTKTVMNNFTTIGNQNALFFGVRLRQVRALANRNCHIPKILAENLQKQLQNESCVAEYTQSIESKDDYRNFTYSSQEITTETTLQGKIATYGGGGFVIDLKKPKIIDPNAVLDNVDTFNDLQNALKPIENQLVNLQQNKYIDEQTRAIIHSVTIYNPNYNLFATCNIVVEFSISGDIYTTVNVESNEILELNLGDTSISTSFNGYRAAVISFAVLSVLCMLVFNVYWLLRLYKENFTELIVTLSFYVDSSLVGLFIYIIIAIFARYIIGSPALIVNKAIASEYQEFSVAVLQVNHWLRSLQSVYGLTLLILSLRSFKYFRVLRIFSTINGAFSSSIYNIVRLTGIFLIVLIGFAIASFLASGMFSENFNSFQGAIEALLILLVGGSSDEIRIIHPYSFFEYIYLTIFIYLFVYLFRGLLFAILIDAWRRQLFFEMGNNDQFSMTETFRNFLRVTYKKFSSCFRRYKDTSSSSISVGSSNNLSGMNKFDKIYFENSKTVSVKSVYDLIDKSGWVPNNEIPKRLNDWHEKRNNQGKTDLTWKDLAEALQGEAYNFVVVDEWQIRFLLSSCIDYLVKNEESSSSSDPHHSDDDVEKKTQRDKDDLYSGSILSRTKTLFIDFKKSKLANFAYDAELAKLCNNIENIQAKSIKNLDKIAKVAEELEN